MYVPRVEPYDFERPPILLRVLDALEGPYLASVHNDLDTAIQHERLHAWYADAGTAAARISDGPYGDQIAASYERARHYIREP